MRTVSEVAQLTGVTVRALHHYDEIGLLEPSERSEAGYRLYSHGDLQRLQEILGWRELGFPLAEVRALMDDPHYDREGALRRQRGMIDETRERLGRLAKALDAALAAHRDGMEQEEATMFDGIDPSRHEDEARERWGQTEAYAESMRRTKSYGESDWRSIREEADEIAGRFAQLMRAGADPAGEEARAAARSHREHISRWFYECTPEIHRGLGEMYVADPRFTENWDKHAPGLAVFVRDAIAAS